MSEASVKALKIGALVDMADTRYPDTEDGRSFLTGVRDAVLEAIDYGQDRDDAISEIADSAVPIYTADLWRTFTDLAAWAEDPTELGFDGGDMFKGAQMCVYLIATRLAYEVWDEYESEDDD